ncbi:1,4-alpha-glucan branching protein GlgB [Anaerolentibacter hominis]|uniref:1,4-alpha-glucan branching protein GlgB n=1 Tax=Anaerolentibacter hominis TaxID=3079009 RepID=UPI0031B82499
MSDKVLKDFYEGNSFTAYEYFGAHPDVQNEEAGVVFRVCAPRAEKVELVGDFNGWEPFEMSLNEAGAHTYFVPGAKEGQMYKYRIHGQDGRMVYKSDPYGFLMEEPPKNASVITSLDHFRFTDGQWMKSRSLNFDKPMSIYEIHFGSWRQKEDGSWYSYEELAELLIPYLKENHFTHVELLPLNEHPLYASWGYLVSCFFSVTSRYGTPEQFMSFVNTCHKNKIGVIMDFVPGHFVTDDFGLLKFDGQPLYEYDAEDVAYNEWGSCNFNYFRGETSSYLKSAANFWLEKFHVDGLRMDAVSNILYWQGDSRRGENEGGVHFLKTMNEGLHKRNKNVMLIAEDSTTFPDVTRPVADGGVGFDYKWDMGWMNDTLEYMKIPPEYKKDHYYKLSFSMMYFYSERFLLSLSHDEVVHGKATILQKMWGDYDAKFPEGRVFYLYMFTHPGKKLNFMGNEIGHFREWDEKAEMDWNLLGFPLHDEFHRYWKDLNEFYVKSPVLYEKEYDPNSFRWLVVDSPEESVFIYERKNKHGSLIIVLNMSDRHYKKFKFGYDKPVSITQVFNSNVKKYGGTGRRRLKPVETEKESYKMWKYSMEIDIPPFTGLIYDVKRVKRGAGKKEAVETAQAKSAGK